MRPGKVILAGLVVTIVNGIIGMVTCGCCFRWVYTLEPTNVWRCLEGPPGIIFFIGSFLLSVLLVLVYGLLYKGIPGKNKLEKGLNYGICVWLVGILPGMFATNTFMTVAFGAVIYLTIMGLITNLIDGIIIAAICSQSE